MSHTKTHQNHQKKRTQNISITPNNQEPKTTQIAKNISHQSQKLSSRRIWTKTNKYSNTKDLDTEVYHTEELSSLSIFTTKLRKSTNSDSE